MEAGKDDLAEAETEHTDEVFNLPVPDAEPEALLGHIVLLAARPMVTVI